MPVNTKPWEDFMVIENFLLQLAISPQSSQELKRAAETCNAVLRKGAADAYATRKGIGKQNVKDDLKSMLRKILEGWSTTPVKIFYNEEWRSMLLSDVKDRDAVIEWIYIQMHLWYFDKLHGTAELRAAHEKEQDERLAKTNELAEAGMDELWHGKKIYKTVTVYLDNAGNVVKREWQ